MMRKGMIVETDHMSMKARRQALSILEAESYPGVISSHSWGDLGSQQRLQALGGIVGPISSMSTDFAEEWRGRQGQPGPELPLRHGLRLRHQRAPLPAQAAPGRRAEPGPLPVSLLRRRQLIGRQRSGTRVYDVNTDGVDHYGLYPDWIEDLRLVAGPQIVNDMANGAEAYLRMWASAEAAAR